MLESRENTPIRVFREDTETRAEFRPHCEEKTKREENLE